MAQRPILKTASGILLVSLFGMPGAALGQTPYFESALKPEETKLIVKRPDGFPQTIYEESHALVIANVKYQGNGWKNLDPIRPEVDLIKEAFEKQKIKSTIYFDLKKSEMLNIIDAFISKYGNIPGSRVIVYVTSHGSSINTGGGIAGYIVPVDGAANGSAGFAGSAIPLAQFDTWARTPAARHMLFVFDSCFAGSIFGNAGKGPPGRPDPREARPKHYVTSDLALGRARQFITAGTGDQEVPANSIFTKLFVQALRGQRPNADVNWDGYLTGQELATYLMMDVPSYYNKDEVPQTPQYGKLRDPLFDIGDMIFALDEIPSIALAAVPEAQQPKPPIAIDLNVGSGSKPAGKGFRNELSTVVVGGSPPPVSTDNSARTAPPVWTSPTDEKRIAVRDLIDQLTSENTKARRKARSDLGRYLSGLDPATSGAIAAQLVRNLPNGTYRYQLGVAAALREVKLKDQSSYGWVSSEPEVSNQQFARALLGAAGKDQTLRDNLIAAQSRLKK